MDAVTPPTVRTRNPSRLGYFEIATVDFTGVQQTNERVLDYSFALGAGPRDRPFRLFEVDPGITARIDLEAVSEVFSDGLVRYEGVFESGYVYPRTTQLRTDLSSSSRVRAVPGEQRVKRIDTQAHRRADVTDRAVEDLAVHERREVAQTRPFPTPLAEFSIESRKVVSPDLFPDFTTRCLFRHMYFLSIGRLVQQRYCFNGPARKGSLAFDCICVRASELIRISFIRYISNYLAC